MLSKAEIYNPEWMAEVWGNHQFSDEWEEAIECCHAGGFDALPDVPAIENIHTRVFEAASAPNALDMWDWHRCETTHCRAGWVVHLAGDAGYRLEDKVGTDGAALLIYRASAPETTIHKASFHTTDEAALADMRACAEREAAR